MNFLVKSPKGRHLSETIFWTETTGAAVAFETTGSVVICHLCPHDLFIS
jgi:hypothetical protein